LHAVSPARVVVHLKEPRHPVQTRPPPVAERHVVHACVGVDVGEGDGFAVAVGCGAGPVLGDESPGCSYRAGTKEPGCPPASVSGDICGGV
jgi:hypothetical protein